MPQQQLENLHRGVSFVFQAQEVKWEVMEGGDLDKLSREYQFRVPNAIFRQNESIFIK